MKIIKKFILCLGIILVMVLPCQVIAHENEETKFYKVDTVMRIEQYDWVYKTVNGVMYKRLFNLSTGEWASDWMRA